MLFGRNVEMPPVHAGFRRQRRFEIVSERRTERSLISGRNANLIDGGRIGAFVGNSQKLGDRLALGRKRIGRETDALRFIASRLGLDLRRLHGLFRGDRLRLDVGNFLRQRMAALGNLIELLPVRRVGCDVGDLRIE